LVSCRRTGSAHCTAPESTRLSVSATLVNSQPLFITEAILSSPLGNTEPDRGR